MNTATAAPVDVKTIDVDTLYALERRAGWEPASLREDARRLEEGDHVLADALANVYGALESTVAAMRHAADVIEENGRQAAAELADRRAAAPALAWSYRA